MNNNTNTNKNQAPINSNLSDDISSNNIPHEIKALKSNAVDVSLSFKYSTKLEQGNNYVDLTMMTKKPTATIKKLSKEEYLIVSSGKVKKYQPKDDKDIDVDVKKNNLKRTFNRLRQLIRTNFVGKKSNQLFITLTYEENMQDTKRLMKDFDVFYKRLKRKLNKHDLDYIAVAEPQGRGAWHFHLMLKSNNQQVLYIDNKELHKIWGHGYTDTQRLKSDDVGSYYVAYFTDLLADGDNSKGNSKKRIKGARLHMYPKNFKFYRCSRGIKEPTKTDTSHLTYKQIEEQLKTKGFERTYKTSFNICEVEYNKDRTEYKIIKVVNSIHKETWKRRRH